MTETRLWKGGRIFTGHAYHEAILVEDDRILAVGSLSEVRRDRPTGTEEHDLAGGMLIPGLIDAHLHLAELVLKDWGVDGASATSVADLVDRARHWAETHPVGPVIGGGWRLPDLPPTQWPSRSDLDRIDTDRPVLLYHASGHAVVVNSAALDALGIGRGTSDPPGGRIGRDSRGEPNGLLLERGMEGATRIAHNALVADPASLEGLLHRLASLGITSVGTMNTSSPELQALTTLASESRLTVRVSMYLALSWFASLSDRAVRTLVPSSPRLRIGGVKTVADGAFGSRTAWLAEPYRDEPGNYGMSVHGAAEMIDAFRRARELGLTPAVHALGDRGVDRALDVLERSRTGNADRGDRLEHAGLVPPALMAKVRRVRPIMVVQPAFVWSDDWLVDRIGEGRRRYVYPFRTLLEAGCPLAGSSDAPFDTLDPWVGLQAANHRSNPQGKSANPDPREELSVDQVFEMYTMGGARALHEPLLGGLVPGAPADFLWVDAPRLEFVLAQGRERLRETWVGGQRVLP